MLLYFRTPNDNYHIPWTRIIVSIRWIYEWVAIDDENLSLQHVAIKLSWMWITVNGYLFMDSLLDNYSWWLLFCNQTRVVAGKFWFSSMRFPLTISIQFGHFPAEDSLIISMEIGQSIGDVPWFSRLKSPSFRGFPRKKMVEQGF